MSGTCGFSSGGHLRFAEFGRRWQLTYNVTGGLGGRAERETQRVGLREGEGGVSFRCVRHPTLRDTPQGLGEPTLRAPSMAISFGVVRAICSA